MADEEQVKKIEANFERFRKLCGLLGDRSEAVSKMVDALGERLATCPASSKTSFHCAYAGGLIEHSLRVLAYAKKLAMTLELDVPKESLILATLFHDIGKVGSLEQDRYLPQDSGYHFDRGNVYRYNNDLVLRTTDCSLFLLQHFGVSLTDDEYLAIRLADGQYEDANRGYGMEQPDLAMLVHTADVWATREEKRLGRTSL